MNTTTKTAAAAVALIATLLLAGCSSTDVFSGEPKAEPAATATTTPAPLDGDENGDGKLSEREKELIAKRSYTLLDGTVVPTPTPKQGEAIPEAIIENIKAQGASDAAALHTGSGFWEASEALEALLELEDKRVGRKILPVVQGTDGLWGSGRPGLEVASGCDKETAVAAADALAASNDRYVVIVFD
ncbi:hypothetical protein [Mycetocola zhujimingii]|uniref:Uncharacterized protein n=1 Tax=Mycetocola zhujimingii TaxID=2079792 RepID=A0A2U1TGU7_9MICO|nr:hypothetical protein [Mycetocola zhujimingii]PWC08121.1 hypothetical protein DF223_01840 [Mycetocola zhujimingii]